MEKEICYVMLSLENLEKCFYEASQQNKKYVGIKSKVEGYKKTMIIICENKDFDDVFSDYKDIYNDDLTLKEFEDRNRIVGFTYGDSFEGIEKDLLG